MLLPKKHERWHMCVEFLCLNNSAKEQKFSMARIGAFPDELRRSAAYSVFDFTKAFCEIATHSDGKNLAFNTRTRELEYTCTLSEFGSSQPLLVWMTSYTSAKALKSTSAPAECASALTEKALVCEGANVFASPEDNRGLGIPCFSCTNSARSGKKLSKIVSRDSPKRSPKGSRDSLCISPLCSAIALSILIYKFSQVVFPRNAVTDRNPNFLVTSEVHFLPAYPFATITTVNHPEAARRKERTNHLLLQHLELCTSENSMNWLDYLPCSLRACAACHPLLSSTKPRLVLGSGVTSHLWQWKDSDDS
ncbi:hypothetical protein cyc_01918 [Cyclospora cayetanensis]|uniref:Uncharacterized protein n=1 Tax=Cyclospora cayetanensis TaxID=88456 RepID=A0A1D3CSS5_9EIME|nr:hypothetical protein cyc_01918 [Cyclospora cayetanensis]